jgi:peptidyl-dipeptidase A
MTDDADQSGRADRAAAAADGRGTATEALAFLERAESALSEASTRAERARWVYATYITDDTSQIAAEAHATLLSLNAELALEAAAFDAIDLPEAARRRLDFLKLALPSLAADTAGNTELSRLSAWLEGAYATGRHAPVGGEPLTLDALSRILAASRDPAELLDVWGGWHAVGVPMRAPYRRFVEISNEGARALGYRDNADRWLSSYDLSAEAFEAEVERLWRGVEALHRALHAFARRRLVEAYGDRVVSPSGPIPAHLLGDMWAQEWGNIADLILPDGGAVQRPYDLTALLEAHGYDAVAMVRTGEAFFTSLGFDPLPETFWSRSMFTRPADRDVVCHASAWDIDDDLDLRLKMCVEITEQDFVTIHHELGHTFYQRAYRHQPMLFRSGANDGFHEAIGDAIARSVTPEYLVRIGLLDEAPGPEADIALLLREALDTFPRLAWAMALEHWRWEAFSGETPFERWNERYWELRRRYQGIEPADTRPQDAFDPGAKYHVADNTPYIRYYLATFLQFQFHKGLTEAAGVDGPLHRRSIHGSRAAGDRLERMLELGRSRPWPEALAVVAGSPELDAGPLLEYFAPLAAWLDEQNEGVPVGW